MTTPLQQLIADRQRDLGMSSLIATYRAAHLPDGSITYETLRRIASGKQRAIREDRTYVDLAAILRVSVDDVKSAEAGYTPVGGWKRYESLTDREKQAVEAVMDAILAAHDEGGSSDDRQSEAEKSPHLHADDQDRVRPIDVDEIKGILDDLPTGQVDQLWADYDATRRRADR
ncbi:hypothetical protein KJZ00_09745 [Cutibacterium avidum]|uniref:hypothetical protein n=1 Tax=Cutibacterium avidum TaxID=33010 RepID=UPI0020941BEB|nr:hypothetical protein [Cutibacterium avidum]MCO6661016.1 hypothetical protein [Cutibacterium avidum]